MNNKYIFVIITSHTTKHILPCFTHLFNKYVNPEEKVLLLGNYEKEEIITPQNFEYIRRCDLNYPIANWTKTIYDEISKLPHDYIILGLDDFFPVRQFDYSIFNEMLKYMDDNPKAVRYDFGPGIVCDYPCELLENRTTFDILQQAQYANYRCSTQFSIWKKDYLLKKLEQPRTPWDFENVGSEEARNDGNYILGTNRAFCWHWIESSAVSSKNPNKINVLGLKIQDIKELISLGYLEEERLIMGQHIGGFNYSLYKENFNFDIFKQIVGDSFEYKKLEFKYKSNY